MKRRGFLQGLLAAMAGSSLLKWPFDQATPARPPVKEPETRLSNVRVTEINSIYGRSPVAYLQGSADMQDWVDVGGAGQPVPAHLRYVRVVTQLDHVSGSIDVVLGPPASLA